MLLKSIAYKTALLGGLVLSSVVYEPALATTEDLATDEALPDDEMMHHECGEEPMFDPEADEMDLEGWNDELFDEEDIQPDNIELVIEAGGDTYTQMVYFAADSSNLSEPAQMIIDEIAADLHAQELAFVLVTEGSSESQILQAERIARVTTALSQAGLPSSWVQIDQPFTLAGL